MRAGLGAALISAAALMSGCYSMVGDESSIAMGTTGTGALRNAVRLPLSGDGYTVPPRWRARGNNWGTEELVDLIVRAARRVERDIPGSELGVADLSPQFGGSTQWHRSHENGLDADLIFFTRLGGKAVGPPNVMQVYGADGTTRPPVAASGEVIDPEYTAAGVRTIDVGREWALVRALVTDPFVEVQYLFVYEPLRQRLLAYAAAHGEDPALIAEAAEILRQPVGAAAHDDHLHLRIYCPESDRELGCQASGPLRWRRKLFKYGALLAQAAPDVVAQWIAPVASFTGVLCSIGPEIL